MVRPFTRKWITLEILKQIDRNNKARAKHRKGKNSVKNNFDAWKKEERKLTDMKKGAKQDFKNGKVTGIVTRKDWDEKMDRDLKYK